MELIILWIKTFLFAGAAPVVRRGDGDDDGCIDDDFDKWSAELHDALEAANILSHHSVDHSGSGAVDVALLPAYDVVIAPFGASATSPFPQGSGTSAASPFWAPVLAVRELHGAESPRSCVHVELDVTAASGMQQYEAGDHVAVFAQNQPAVVDEVAAVLGMPPDTLVSLVMPRRCAALPGAEMLLATEVLEQELKAAGVGTLAEPPPGPLPLRTLLAYFADVLSPPHRESLAALSVCACVPAEAERLRRLSSAAGRTDYQTLIHKPRRSLLEV